MKIQELLYQAAEKWPEKPAIIDTQGEMSFARLVEAVNLTQREFHRCGVGENMVVGIMLGNGREFIISAFAALACGAVIMPIWCQLKESEIQEMLQVAPLQAVVHNGAVCRCFSGVTHEISVQGITYLCLTFCEINSFVSEIIGQVNEPAYIRFTSGTTGKAKGVLLTHQDVDQRTSAANGDLRLGEEDVVVCVLPMAYHFIVSIIMYLRYGCTTVVCRDYMAATILAAVNDHEATVFYGSPINFRMLAADRSGKTLKTLRYAISTSSGLAKQISEDFKRRYQVNICQAYGCIEVGLPMVGTNGTKPDSVGKPGPAYEAEIFDNQFLPLPYGDVGQLWLRGKGLFSAYLQPPKLRTEITRDGWFATGDLARKDKDGDITICGRSNSVINVLGNKVFPEEVEAVLNNHPGVAAARVFGRNHEHLGEAVQAEVQLSCHDALVNEAEIISFCRRHLSAFKVPQGLTILNLIEETASGKIKRN